jgi:ubiquinone/menaquinone biosynthesis C-methylase UbiE
MLDIARDARFWDRIARKYAADPIRDEGGYERTLARTQALLAPADQVLEFACGTGTTALRLAPSVARYVATDISPEMIAIAREKAGAGAAPGLEFAVGTPEDGVFPDESFDAVLGFNALHLIRDRAASLAGLRRMLKPGGLLVTKTPCLSEMNPLIRLAVPLMQLIGKAPYVAFFSAGELERAIAEAGFTIIARERHATKGRDVRPFLVARKV